jgi:hypothetical protein
MGAIAGWDPKEESGLYDRALTGIKYAAALEGGGGWDQRDRYRPTGRCA